MVTSVVQENKAQKPQIKLITKHKNETK